MLNSAATLAEYSVGISSNKKLQNMQSDINTIYFVQEMRIKESYNTIREYKTMD